MREIDKDGTPKGDWIEMKDFYPPPETPTDKNETARSRQGLTGTTKPLTPEEQNVLIFYDLVIKADKNQTEDYFSKTYLTNDDIKKVVKVQANLDRKVLVVSLTDMQSCKDFVSKYVSIPFNDSNPKVSIMLGGKSN